MEGFVRGPGLSPGQRGYCYGNVLRALPALHAPDSPRQGHGVAYEHLPKLVLIRSLSARHISGGMGHTAHSVASTSHGADAQMPLVVPLAMAGPGWSAPAPYPLSLSSLKQAGFLVSGPQLQACLGEKGRWAHRAERRTLTATAGGGQCRRGQAVPPWATLPSLGGPV